MKIEDLLKGMLTFKDESITSNSRLENSKETWERIGNQDSFSELSFSSVSEKDEFLKEWVEENPYTAI